ncbi:MAG: hypothetical protein QOD99_2415 [Chthoniobacter sp.]|jgi:undecaprenyl-diphosphatase|nr:hypothetical protein [Chthoniobacter sp.]
MEQKLLFLINREWTSPALDRFMALMSSFDFWMWPLAAAGVLMVIFGGAKARLMLLVLGLTVGLSDGGVANSLKKIALRPRPHEVLADVRRIDLRRTKPRWAALFLQPKPTLSRPEPGVIGGRSFPSAHTVDNFAAAVVLTMFYKRCGWIWFIVAGVVGYSRIYVGAHWPSDIAASVPLGIGCGLVVVAACELIWRKCGARLAPNVFVKMPRLVTQGEA